MKKIYWMIAVCLLAIATPVTAADVKEKSAIWAHSDGNGVVSLFWLPGESWPAEGWKLERIGAEGTKVLEAKIIPGTDQDALAKIPVNEADELRKFAREVQGGKINKDKSEMAVLIFGMKGVSEIPFGHAAGLRYTDREGSRGKRSYRLVENRSGGKEGEVAKTPLIDPYEATSAVKKIESVTVTQPYEGVSLSWRLPKGDVTNPPAAYIIERKDPDGAVEKLTPKPLLISDDLDKEGTSLFIDKMAPAGSIVTYRVYALGLFGNMSLPAETTVTIKDTKALMPPENLAAKEGTGEVRLTWKENSAPGCAGYVLERAFLIGGPYEALTPEGLSRTTMEYSDKNLRGGSAYYYRIRSVDAKGEVGHPSYAVMGQPIGSETPSRVKGLKADAGRSIITLTWDKSAVAVAGYMVYRKQPGSVKWSQLSTYVVPGNRYDDHVGELTYGSYQYRVSAVGFDSKEGEPSSTLEVALIDTISPNPPYITDIDGADGRVKISFKAAPPYEDVKGLYLVRSVSETDQGLVIGDEISPKASQVTDTFVRYGQRYWYRMVAVDKAGNRSDLGRAKTVVVQNPPIPAPDAPKLEFETSPISHIVIRLGKIPQRLSALIQRQTQGEWKGIMGAVNEETVIDTKIPQTGTIRYRVVYQAENGAQGKASPIAEVKIPAKR